MNEKKLKYYLKTNNNCFGCGCRRENKFTKKLSKS